jgi:hypothetical protein
MATSRKQHQVVPAPPPPPAPTASQDLFAAAREFGEARDAEDKAIGRRIEAREALEAEAVYWYDNES